MNDEMFEMNYLSNPVIMENANEENILLPFLFHC